MKKLLALVLLVSSAAMAQDRFLTIPQSSNSPQKWRAILETDLPNIDWSKIYNTPTSYSGYGLSAPWLLGSGGTLTGNNTISGAGSYSLTLSGLTSFSGSSSGSFAITGGSSGAANSLSLNNGSFQLGNVGSGFGIVSSTNLDFTYGGSTRLRISNSAGVVQLPAANGTLGFYDQIGGNAVSSLVTTPTSGEDGYVLKWDNGNNRYTLGASAGISDGDKGDVVVSSSGTVWTLDAALTTAPSGYVVVGNASNVATAVPMSGVVAIDNTGATTFPTERVKVTGTSTMTGDVTIGGAYDWNFSGTKRLQFAPASYTATANNDYLAQFTGTMTGRATSSDVFRWTNLTGTMVSGAASQTASFFRLAPTFTATGGAFSNSYILEAVGTNGTLVVDATGTLRSPRGISLDASSTGGSNLIQFANGSQQIAASGNNNKMTFSGGSETTSQTERFLFNHTFAPTSLSSNSNLVNFTHTINQTGGANGSTGNTVITTVPTAVVGAHTQLLITTSGTANPTNGWTALNISPTVGTGTFYGMVVPSTSINNGFGTSTPSDMVHIQGGNLRIGGGTSAGLLKFMEPSGSGSNFTTISAVAQSADINYTWPSTAPTANNQVMISSTGGALSWSNISLDNSTGVSAPVSTYSTGGLSIVNNSVSSRFLSINEGSGNVSTTTDGNADNSIYQTSGLPNNTVAVLSVIVLMVKSDGSEAGSVTFTSTWRKDNSGTLTKVGDTTPVVTEDLAGTITASTVSSGSFIQVRVNRSGTSGNFRHNAFLFPIATHSY